MILKNKEIKVDLFAVAPGVWGMKDLFVNMYAIVNSDDNTWILVDAGLKWSAPKIRKMVEILFGSTSKPYAIILTHGHFDHVGSLAKLAMEWDIPIYAHHLEMPYLTGVSSYPPPDPTVGGGLMADLSFIYPKGPINIEERVISLPQGGMIPGLPEWKYIHTPGHTPGHISLFRESDKILIAGDAFVTIKAESMLSTVLQAKKLSGPPKYFTSDWQSAASSVDQLAKLEPEVVATGHGRPMRGTGMRKSLHTLVQNFNKVAVPRKGRYVYQPALADDTGVVLIPPKDRKVSASPTLKILGVSAVILLSMLLFERKRKKKKARIESENKYKMKHEGRNKYNVKRELSKKQSVKDKLSKMKEPVQEELSNLKGSAKHTLNKLKQPVQDKLGKMKEPVHQEFSNLKEHAKHKISKLKEPVKDKFSELKYPLENKLNKIKHRSKKGLRKFF